MPPEGGGADIKSLSGMLCGKLKADEIQKKALGDDGLHSGSMKAFV